MTDNDLTYAININKQFMITWNELPQEIQERMLEEQELQGNKRDASVFEKHVIYDKLGGGINWGDSKEGMEFWNEIIMNKNIDHFYTLYPKLKKNPDGGVVITEAIGDSLPAEKIIIKTDGEARVIGKQDHFTTSSGLKVYKEEKLMWVSNDKNFSDKVKRVVFAEKGGIYLSWGVCDDLEYSKNYITTMNWNFAKEIEPPKTFTLDQAKQALAKEHGLSIDEVEIVK